MKTRTIKKVLRSKFDQFAESIKDENVRALVKNNSMITGGAIASMLLREDVADYDVYFRNKETVLAVANYYVNQFKELGGRVPGPLNTGISVWSDPHSERVRIMVKSAGVAALADTNNEYRYFEMNNPDDPSVDQFINETIATGKNRTKQGKYIPAFLSGNAITLSDEMQLILRFWGEPDQIHANYDFVHCKNIWTSWDNKLILNPEALECLLTKELRYFGSRYPIASVIRTRKFIQRGWTITAGQYLKMMLQLQDLDLTNTEVLMDQLMGVDLSYFQSLITQLSQIDSNNIDSNYLMQLIDELTW